MAVKNISGSMNVVEAANKRINNVFANGVKVYLSFSAGKDSLCLAHLVYAKIKAFQIDPKQLIVIFIDEEAIYPSMEAMAMRWRQRFMQVGAEFRWYCLPLKQVSAFHQLQNDESWITWEPGLENDWVRRPPPFAITRSPYLKYAGQINYQDFCSKITRDGIQIMGVRASESVQRQRYFASMEMSANNISGRNAIYPIYDWHDSDVWLYIKEHNLDYPDSYIDLYRAGTARNRLRLSNFFGADSCAGLRHIIETDPKLWEQIERREPNAYLAMLYWDSEMFKRSTRQRRELEGESTKDYLSLLKEMLLIHPEKYFTNNSSRRVAGEYRRFFVRYSSMMTHKHLRIMYEALVAGDPKLRSIRALYISVFKAYADEARADRARKAADK